MLAALLNQTRGTLTNLLCVGGTQDQDWSADYRLYSQDRLDEDVLFDHIRSTLLEHLPEEEPLVVALDDTTIRKTGTKTHGVGWKRDPLGPPFQTNLVRAQRYLQFSAAWPIGGDGQARMVPIDFRHAPTPPKPRKNAPGFDALQETCREALKQQNLNVVCLDRIKRMREKLPAGRDLIINGDGSFSNKPVMGGLPEGVTYLGRGRKDYGPALVAGARGDQKWWEKPAYGSGRASAPLWRGGPDSRATTAGRIDPVEENKGICSG